jgi:hypothetical protein
MVYFTKLLFAVLSAVDPMIYLAAICLALGACLVAALWELEQVRTRWLQRRQMKRVSLKLQALSRRGGRDRAN